MKPPKMRVTATPPLNKEYLGSRATLLLGRMKNDFVSPLLLNSISLIKEMGMCSRSSDRSHGTCAGGRGPGMGRHAGGV